MKSGPGGFRGAEPIPNQTEEETSGADEPSECQAGLVGLAKAAAYPTDTTEKANFCRFDLRGEAAIMGLFQPKGHEMDMELNIDLEPTELERKAIDIIETILDAGGPNTTQSVMDALCDGECLNDLGIDDQAAVELAYEMIDEGRYIIIDPEEDDEDEE